MNMRYMACVLLMSFALYGSEKFSTTIHDDYSSFTNAQDAAFILCVNSGGAGVESGVFVICDNKQVLLFSLKINNNDIENFTDTICDVLAHIESNYNITIQHVCFVAPGVPSADQSYLTHWRLPYAIDAKEIVERSGLSSAIIVNDFLAMSHGVDYINRDNITTLYDVPAEEHGRRVIIGAGDGLGSVIMVWDEMRNCCSSLPAEAGTCNFPAQNQFEFDLAERMKQIRNVSTMHWAYFVSLPGIHYTYKILKKMNLFHDALDLDDPDGMTILAHAHDDGCCGMTADLFFELYARFAYNFVWTTLPFGGLYLVGATATEYPQLLADIFLPEFFNCVASKQSILKRIPIYVIQSEEQLRLYGGARYFLTNKILKIN